MKKIITLLMAATMIIGFSGMSMAADDECPTCVDPGTINRACPVEQEDCDSYPFDYEDLAWERYFEGESYKLGYKNYCDGVKDNRRVMFPACNCDNFQVGDTIDISLEILVNGQTGDNGAYWAQNVGSYDYYHDRDCQTGQVMQASGRDALNMKTYSSQTKACDDPVYNSADQSFYYDDVFVGPYDYWYVDDDGDLQKDGYPVIGEGAHCYDTDADEDEENRVIIIQPDADAINGSCIGHGYVITTDDVESDKSVWAINIPWIRFDLNKIQIGDEIQVRICLKKAVQQTQLDGTPIPCCFDIDPGGICEDPDCCCVFTLGTMGCCEDDTDYALIYPYATPMNSLDWWYGMVITNYSDEDGQAQVTVYETDGDSATVTVDVPANNMYVANNQSLMTAFGGSIGDARAYFEVLTDFSATGFMFIGNDNKSEAMGYLPASKSITIDVMAK